MVLEAPKGKGTTINSRVFVGNLSFSATQRDVEELFSEIGNVVEVFLPSDRVTGRPRGFAIVEFSSSDEAAQAISKFDGHELGGRPLRVNEATERPPRRPPMGGGGGGPRFETRSFDDGGWDGGGRGGGGGGGGGGAGRAKGSRRNLRSKKRSL